MTFFRSENLSSLDALNLLSISSKSAFPELLSALYTGGGFLAKSCGALSPQIELNLKEQSELFNLKESTVREVIDGIRSDNQLLWHKLKPAFCYFSEDYIEHQELGDRALCSRTMDTRLAYYFESKS
jgi:hypothetical protein